jgi:hypothetical protein
MWNATHLVCYLIARIVLRDVSPSLRSGNPITREDDGLSLLQILMSWLIQRYKYQEK